MNNNQNNSNQSTDSLDIYAAKLAYIGTSISTLGDGIQTIAAGLTLESLKKASNQSSQDLPNQSKQTENMQKQIDYLIAELKHIKKYLK
ncbi:translation initiation factor 2 [Lysinibacillus sp. NPDC093210]|uniref:translation initiation factor 2 n=1 Tax=Lysinibacillus sp. NPDC093210 TaxID=3364133 RepID=UPI00380D310E